MTSTSSTTTAKGSSRGGTGKGGRRGRPQLSLAQREAADAARVAKIAALHEQIGEEVEALTADPQWRAMLDAAAKFHTYSLNNQLLIALQAAQLGFSPTRVAGFGTWKALGRSVVKGSTGLAVLAPCTYTAENTGSGPHTDQAAPPTATRTGTAREPADGTAGARVLRGFRVAHVFDISQTEGDPLPDITPELLTGNAPAALWDALAAQVAAHGQPQHHGADHALGQPQPIADRGSDHAGWRTGGGAAVIGVILPAAIRVAAGPPVRPVGVMQVSAGPLHVAAGHGGQFGMGA